MPKLGKRCRLGPWSFRAEDAGFCVKDFYYVMIKRAQLCFWNFCISPSLLCLNSPVNEVIPSAQPNTNPQWERLEEQRGERFTRAQGRGNSISGQRGQPNSLCMADNGEVWVDVMVKWRWHAAVSPENASASARAGSRGVVRLGGPPVYDKTK